jgi:transcriptional regulator with XRE-family HTH domain
LHNDDLYAKGADDRRRQDSPGLRAPARRRNGPTPLDPGQSRSGRRAGPASSWWETGAAAPRLDTLVKIANILSVTLGELVGRTEPSDEVVIQNPRLHALYREINRLSDEDQQALVILLDSLVKRSQLDHILAG